MTAGTAAAPARTPAEGGERVRVGLMLALTFSTGVIDATGYLGLDRVFTGNMTGNVVILGMGLLRVDGLPVIGPLVALGGYVVGAMVAGRTLRTAAPGWTHRTTGVFTAVGIVLAAVAVAAVPLSGAHVAEFAQWTITGALGAAMGAQAAAARHLAVKDVTTVVVTSTLTGLAADSWLGARLGQPWVRRVLAVALIGAGALVGAACVHVNLAIGPALAAVLTLTAAAFGHQRA